MSLRKTLMSHRAVPPWVLSVAVIGLGLYNGWEAIRPDGPAMIHARDVESILSASADSVGEITQYLDRTETLNRALTEGDREVVPRLKAEQKALDHLMEERLTAKRATEERLRGEMVATARRVRVDRGILGALLLSFGVWNLVARRGKNSEQAG